MATLIGKDRRCKRCGHPWIKREDRETKKCPKCKSPYWNKERKVKGSNE